MDKVFATIEGIQEEIKSNYLFDFRFVPENSRIISECISSIGFGHNRKEIYLTCQDWSKQNVKNYSENQNTIDLITEELVNEGYQIVLADKQGNIICLFDFEGCHLKDKAEIKLDYNIGSKIPMYIISLSYENIYKIK